METCVKLTSNFEFQNSTSKLRISGICSSSNESFTLQDQSEDQSIFYCNITHFWQFFLIIEESLIK